MFGNNNMTGNAGYNYYYGVSDNPDLIQWMKDIDVSLNKDGKNIDTVANVVNKLGEQVKYNRDVINHNVEVYDKQIGGLSMACLFGVGGFLVLTALAYNLIKGFNRHDDEIKKTLELVKETRRQMGLDKDEDVKEEE